MRGAARAGPAYRAPYIYYRCPHDRSIPRHAAAHPEHPTVIVREDDLMTALTTFFAEHVFGPDRAAMLAAALPESATEQTAQRTAKAAALRRQLTKIDTAENALISELEAPADPRDRAAQALRQRIRARFTDLFTERTRIEAELSRPGDRHHPGQRPGAPGRTAPPWGCSHRRPGPAHRAAPGRVRHRRRL